MNPLCKISRMPGDPAFVYPNTYARQKTTGPDRLVIGPSSKQVDLMLELSKCLHERLAILYILFAPHSDKERGRYECPHALDGIETSRFFHRFESFLESDARHDVWILSANNSGAIIVYDKHNLLYAYGPLDTYEEVLRSRNIKLGPVAIPAPHTHNYHPEFDDEERALLNYWSWRRLPLRDDNVD